MVTSHPQNFERRLSIRSTWGSKWKEETNLPLWKTIFQLGLSSDNDVWRESVAESAKYKDIIFGDFDDTFNNLPIKVLMGFKWASRFCEFEYLLKTDDDVFVHIPNMFKFLSMPDIPKTRLYAGNVNFDARPIRKATWERAKKYIVTKEEYAYRNYPRFAREEEWYSRGMWWLTW